MLTTFGSRDERAREAPDTNARSTHAIDRRCREGVYRVTQVVKYLGWVDLNVGGELLRPTVTIYCQSKMAERTKS